MYGFVEIHKDARKLLMLFFILVLL